MGRWDNGKLFFLFTLCPGFKIGHTLLLPSKVGFFNKKKGWSTVVILLSKFRVMKMESYWQDFKSLELKVCDNTDLSEWSLLSSMSMIGTIFAESVDGVNTESVSPTGLDLINKPCLTPRSSSELIVWDLYGRETSQSMEVSGNRSESMSSDLKWCSRWISDTRHPYLSLLEHLLRDFFSGNFIQNYL